VSVILAFYVIALLVVMGAGIGVYWIFARHSRWLGAALGLLLVVVLALLWPIPIHGGFTFLGEVLYRDLHRQHQARQEVAKQQKKQAFVERIETRLSSTLSFSDAEPLAGTWSRVQVDGTQPAWYESDSRLLWSDWLPFKADAALPSLQAAKARCQDQPPLGRWALASEAENYLVWKSGGDKLLPTAPASSVSYWVDEDLGLEMPSYKLRHTSNNISQQGGTRPFVVRCVARGPGAPESGYLRKDIPLDEWNRYQLSKLN
jgi:hypothetical protein